MLSKRIFNLIGLAFIGKALATAVVNLPTCTYIKGSAFTSDDCSDDSGTVTSYCIDNYKIYQVKTSGGGSISCLRTTLGAGLYVFKTDKCESVTLAASPTDWIAGCSYYSSSDTTCTGTAIDCGNTAYSDGVYYKKTISATTKIDIENTNIAAADIPHIALYNCDGTQCKQTSGYIRDKNNKIYKVAIDGATDITASAVNGCNSGDVDQTGNINNGSGADFKYCESQSNALEANGNIYRVEVVASNIFTGSAGLITIKTQTNIFAYDNLADGLDLKPCVEYSKTVFGASFNEASSCKSSDPHVNFCIHGTKIYSLSVHNSCRSNFSFTAGSGVVHSLGLSDNNLNVVKIDGTEKIYNLVSNIAKIKNYVLVDCDSGVCRQTQGYLLNNDKINAFVGTKSGDESESLVVIDGSSVQCDANNIGKVYKNKSGICVKNDKTALLNAAGGNYLISGAKENTPFEDSKYSVALKVTDKYIIKDKFNSEVNLYFSDDAILYDKTKFDSQKIALETAASVSKYSLYDCNEGVCKRTSGYIKSGIDIFAFVGTAAPVKAESDPFVGNPVIGSKTDCGNGKEGKLIAKTGICYGASGIDIPFSSGVLKILLREVAVKGTPFYDADYSVPIRSDSMYIARDRFYNKGVVLVKKATGVIIEDISTANNDITLSPENNVLMECVEGFCMQTSGYIKNGSNIIAFVEENGGTDGKTSVFKSNKAEIEKCDVNSVGMLINSVGAVCLGHGDAANSGKGVEFGDVMNEYLIKKGTAAVGTPFRDDKYDVPIKSDMNYIIRDRYYSLFSLFNKEKYTIVDKQKFNSLNTELKDATDRQNYYIYDCKNGDCKQTFGYIKSNDDVIAFAGGSYAVPVTTDPDTPFMDTAVASDNNSCGSHVGEILNDSGKSGVCYANGKEILFTSAGTLPDIYIMLKGMAAKGTPFEDNVNSVAVRRDPAFIIRDQFYTAVNLVLTTDGTVQTDFTATITPITDKVIVDCVEGICKQTQGYIKDGSATPVGYAFVGDAKGVATGSTAGILVGDPVITQATGCTSTNVGQIITDATASIGVTGICYGSGSKVIKFEAGTARNIILKGKAVPGTPFADRVNDVAIKHSANYIIRDRFYTAVNLVKKEDGTVETDYTKNLSIQDEDKVLIDCVDGVCTQTQGYINNKGKTYAFVGEASGVVITASQVSGSSCTNNSIGKLVMDKSAVCTSLGKSVAFETKNDDHIILKGAAAKGTPFENTEEIKAVKRSANYIVIDHHLTTLKLVKVAEGTLHDIDITDLLSNPNHYILVECVGGVCRQTQGYIKGTSSIIGFIGTSVGENVSSRLAVTGINKAGDCIKDHIGKFFSTTTSTYSDVCIKAAKSIKFDEDPATFIIMNDGTSVAATGTPFEDAENIVPIRRGSNNYIIRDQFYTAVNLVKVVDGTVISDDELKSVPITLSEGYILVDCVDGVCKQTQGYVVDGEDNGIAFKGSSNGVATKDNVDYELKGTTDASGNALSPTCIAEKEGMIKSDNSGVCIHAAIEVNLSGSGIGKHIIIGDNTPFSNAGSNVPVKHGANYFVVDMFESVYLYESTTQSITTDVNSEYSGITTPATVESYGIVDCKDGICKPTMGIIKVYGNSLYNIVISGNGSNGVVTSERIDKSVKEDIDCTEDNIGMIFSDKSGICYMYGGSLKFGEKSGIYLIMEGTAATSSLFTGVDGYPVKSVGDFIVLDQLTDKVNLVKVEDQSVVEEFTTEKTPGDYIIVDCKYNAVVGCRQTSGYVLNGKNKNVFGFIDLGVGVDVTSSLNGGSNCVSTNIGKYIKNGSKYYVCIGDGMVEFKKSDALLFMMNGSAVEGTPFNENEFMVSIKQGDYYVVRNKFSDGVNDGVILVNKNDGKTDVITNLSDDNKSSFRLVQCQSGNCKTTNGYVKKSTNYYAFVNDVVEKVAPSSIADNSGCDYDESGIYNVGKITVDGKMCIGHQSAVEFSATVKEYTILNGKHGVTGTPFEDWTDDASRSKRSNGADAISLPIIRTADYIIRDQFYNKVILVNPVSGEVIPASEFHTKTFCYVDGEELNPRDVRLMDCENGVCKGTVGYVMAACQGHLALFSEINVGGVTLEYYDVGVIYNEINKDIEKKYSIGNRNTIFGGENGEFSMVRQSVHCIVKDVFYGDVKEDKGERNDGDGYCSYIDSRGEIRNTRICKEDVYGGPGKYSNFKCVDGICNTVPEENRKNDIENGIYLITVEGKEVMVKCSKNHCYKMTDEHVLDIRIFNNSGMFVFENNYDRDQKLLDDKALNGLRGIVKKSITLNHCVHGICTRTTNGFIKYSRSRTAIAKYAYNGVTATTTITLTSFVNCDVATDDGELKSNMDMCINGASKVSEAIVGVGVLQGYPTLRLYQKTGYNVVGVVVSGYYNFGTKVANCEGGTCNEITLGDGTKDGFYINSDTNTDDEYKLIYCESVASVLKCENRRLVENGYYWKTGDNGNNVIICDNSGCKVTPTIVVTTDCSTPQNVNKNKLVFYGGGYKYCKDATTSGGSAITNSLTYYASSSNYEPESKFNYPTGFVNSHVPESKILIKTQQYSVTAVTGDNIPIGYVKTGNKYLECKFNEEGKRVCVDAEIITATECESENVGKLIKVGGVTKLCVDPTIDPVNISSGTGEYLIALGNGKFGIEGSNDGKEYFIGVKVADGNVVVVKEPKMNKYRYTGTDLETHKKSLLKVYNRSEATGLEKKDIYEFQVVVWPIGSDANPAVDYDISGDNSDLYV